MKVRTKKDVESLANVKDVLLVYPNHSIVTVVVATPEMLMEIDNRDRLRILSRRLEVVLREETGHKWCNLMAENIENWDPVGVESGNGELAYGDFDEPITADTYGELESAWIHSLVDAGYVLVQVEYGSEVHHMWNERIRD